MTGSGIGEPVKGREDVRPLTGHGRYADDWNAPGKVLAQEFGRDGIRVNAVSPGIVRARA